MMRSKASNVALTECQKDRAKLLDQNQKLVDTISKLQNDNRILKLRVSKLVALRLNLLTDTRRDVATQTHSESQFSNSQDRSNTDSFSTPPSMARNVVSPESGGLNPNFKVTSAIKYMDTTENMTETNRGDSLLRNSMSTLEFTELESSLMAVEIQSNPFALTKHGEHQASFQTEDSFEYSRYDKEDEDGSLSFQIINSPLHDVERSVDTPCKRRVSKVLQKRLSKAASRSTRMQVAVTMPDIQVLSDTPSRKRQSIGPISDVDEAVSTSSTPADMIGLVETTSTSFVEEVNDDQLSTTNSNDMVPIALQRTPRSVKKPVSYQEPSLTAKVRKGYKWFKFET